MSFSFMHLSCKQQQQQQKLNNLIITTSIYVEIQHKSHFKPCIYVTSVKKVKSNATIFFFWVPILPFLFQSHTYVYRLNIFAGTHRCNQIFEKVNSTQILWNNITLIVL